MPEIGPLPKTPEWESLRKFDPNRSRPVVFGASEAAAACGVSRYEQPLALYLKKRGEMEAFEPDAQQAERMAFGLAMESVILGEYSKRRGVTIRTGLPMYLSPVHSFMGATPDALAERGDAEWVVECKNSTDRMWDRHGENEDMFGQEGTDQVPIEYLFQAQQQMAVLELDRVEFPVLFNGNTLKIYEVRRDDAIIDRIVEAEAELAQRIINGDQPPVDYNHKSAADCVRSMQATAGTVVDLTDEMAALWSRIKKADRLAKLIEDRRDIDKLKFMDLARDAEYLASSELYLKRIRVQGSSFTVERQPYSYFKAVKGNR